MVDDVGVVERRDAGEVQRVDGAQPIAQVELVVDGVRRIDGPRLHRLVPREVTRVAGEASGPDEGELVRRSVLRRVHRVDPPPTGGVLTIRLDHVDGLVVCSGDARLVVKEEEFPRTSAVAGLIVDGQQDGVHARVGARVLEQV